MRFATLTFLCNNHKIVMIDDLQEEESFINWHWFYKLLMLFPTVAKNVRESIQELLLFHLCLCINSNMFVQHVNTFLVLLDGQYKL